MFDKSKINSLGEFKDQLDGVLKLFGIDATDRISDTIRLAMVGATSVGKSSTINALIGRNICKVGHVGNTTRNALWIPQYLSKSNQPDFYLLDLPGWGVSKSVDADYKIMLTKEDNLPQADAVLWIMKADALGTLTYDLEWIEDTVLPCVGNNSTKLVIGVNQIENIYDYDFSNGSPSKTLIATLNQKCQLIYDETKKIIPNLEFKQIQSYSAAKGFRVLPLLRQLTYAAGDKGWILDLISKVSEENDPFYKK